MRKLFLLFSTLSGLMFAQTFSTGTQMLQGDLSVNIETDETTTTLTLTGPLNVWFSVGFGGATMSSGADIFRTDGTTIVDARTTGYLLPPADTSQDWTLVSNNVTLNARTIVATRSNNTGDSNDYIFTRETGSISLIWAIGSSTTYGYHGSRGATVLAVTEVLPPPVPPDCSIGKMDNTGSTLPPSDYNTGIAGGIKLTVPQGGTLTSLNLVGNNTSANVQMALYEDDSNAPGNLIAESSPGVVGEGLVSLPVPPTSLPAGDYWVMAAYDSAARHIFLTGSGTLYAGILVYGDPFPEDFSTVPSSVATTTLPNYSMSIVCGELTEKTFTIAAETDDAEEEVSSGSMDVTSSDLELIEDGEEQVVGLRFENVQIPARGILHSAYIQFTVDETDSEATSLTFRGEMATASTTFTDTDSDISSRTTTSESAVWNNVPAWNSTGEDGIRQRSPSLVAIIEEITAQSGWDSGNPLTFIISGNGKRVAESYDTNDSSDGAPVLSLFYSCNPAGTVCDDGDATTVLDLEDGNCNCLGVPKTAAVTYSVNHDDDDAEEVTSTTDMGSVSLDSSDLELIEDGSDEQVVGLRFNDILIPAGATISDAYIQFTADNSDSGTTNLVIQGEKVLHSVRFTEDDSNLSSRTKTTASVAWDAVADWATGDAAAAQRSPDVKDIIQEIIDQEGWRPFNSMSFFITGSGVREAESHDSGQGAAQLIINYTYPVVVWTGATDNDWATAGNWDTGTVPGTTSQVVIPNTGITNYPTVSTAVTVASIIINSGATLVLSGDDAAITGDITYIRHLPTNDWYLISTPLSGVERRSFIASHPLATGSGTNLGLAHYEGDVANWFYYSTADNVAIMGQGYSIKLATPGDVSFRGISRSDYGSALLNTASEPIYSLIGNISLAYLNSGTFLTSNTSSLDQETIWVWDGAQYLTYNVVDPLEIAPAQGFFVESLNGFPLGIVPIDYGKSNQSHQATDTFLKTAPKTSFELFANNGSLKSSARVFYVENKTTGFDNGYDSSIFGGVAPDFAIFTELPENSSGEKLSIQTLPGDDFSNIIPVGLIAAAGDVTFSVHSENFPDGRLIYLEDKENSTMTNLSRGSHTVTLQNDAGGSGRFYIHTVSQSLSNEDLAEAHRVNIYKSATKEITVSGVRDRATIQVFSILGEELMSTGIVSSGGNRKTIALNHLASGIYVVRLTSERNTVTKKIILD